MGKSKDKRIKVYGSEITEKQIKGLQYVGEVSAVGAAVSDNFYDASEDISESEFKRLERLALRNVLNRMSSGSVRILSTMAGKKIRRIHEIEVEYDRRIGKVHGKYRPRIEVRAVGQGYAKKRFLGKPGMARRDPVQEFGLAGVDFGSEADTILEDGSLDDIFGDDFGLLVHEYGEDARERRGSTCDIRGEIPQAKFFEKQRGNGEVD